LHALSIFILLGLSADAVFLVQDSWQQAPTPSAETIEKSLREQDLTAFLTSSRDAHGDTVGAAAIDRVPGMQASNVTFANAATAEELQNFEQTEGSGNSGLAYDRKLRADEEALVARMHYTWGRALVSLSVTTGTTVVAFLATALSAIVPIATFGIFAATIVFVNYCLALTLYPSAIVLWERNVRPCEASCAKALCGSYCDATTEDASPATAIKATDPSPVVRALAEGTTGPDSDVKTSSSRVKLAFDDGSVSVEETLNGDTHAEATRPIEIFFRDYWSVWMHEYRFYVLGFFGIIIVTFAILAS